MTTEWEKADQESLKAKRMLERADKILAAVDDAYIIKERGHAVRAMPTFRAEEVSLGKVLGTGGFGIVNEIKGFFLDKEEEAQEDVALIENPQDTNGAAATSSSSNSSGLRNRNASNNDLATTTTTKTTMQESDASILETHTHYDIKRAKHVMAHRVAAKDGVFRYALKRLHGDLTELEQARGMIDLALEAKYLSTVWHPNIIKMRGMAAGKMVADDFFIIMDRLECTLDTRMNEWWAVNKKCQGFCGFGKKKHLLHELLVERMTVVYDLAAAFFYLHEHRLVYRDIKPENIGFDIRGDAKIFDFGLCKNLSPKLKASGYGYRLTGRAGSLPYMAPEVARMESYDTKCDVFSFAILLWEILSLAPAFKGMTPTEFVEKVVLKNDRLEVPKKWPPLTRLMLPEAWDKDPKKRPDMKRVAIMIRGDLNDMTDDDMILRRTTHMQTRSDHSQGHDSD